MFELIPEEILNAFSCRAKRDELQHKLQDRRTPKKYHEPLKREISRLNKLYETRLAQERKQQAIG